MRMSCCRWLACGVAAFLSVASLSANAGTREDVARFYKGKQITIVVGTTVGGGYDAYARLIARHMGKHVPGHPTFVVTNMPGAGSNVAGFYVYATAPKDGTVIGAVFAGALVEPLIGTTATIHHDPSKFQFLGSANDDVYICIARKDAPVQSFKDAFHKELIMGASAAASTSEFASVLDNVLGTRLKLVIGYNGSKPIMLAMEKGEVQGACGLAWPSISVTNSGWFGPKGTMRVLVQTHVKGYPELNAKGIPLATSFAKTDEQRAIMELFFSQTVFGRPYLVAPEVPADRVAALRKAFMDTMHDPEYLADARKQGLDTDPVDGKEVQRLVQKFYSAPPDLIAKVKAAMELPK
jgi:tripartite-type tricarboxylate transporter receptor subunit TctC